MTDETNEEYEIERENESITKETLEEIDNKREIDNLKKVEAALFVSGNFLSTQELVALTDLNPIFLSQKLSELKEKYNEKSAIEIVNKGDLWKMDVRGEHRDIVNKLATGNDEFTKAEQETLAIIAYKQPITQAHIIRTRGNKAYEHIKKFRDLGLVKAKRVGRTLELNLSDEFYSYFNVNSSKEIFSKKQNKEPEENEQS
ncbi:MAG: SMC-Scp complex subunit ScpB [Candidatus Pacearchaeota archaeon]